jgi:hypothetical protein
MQKRQLAVVGVVATAAVVTVLLIWSSVNTPLEPGSNSAPPFRGGGGIFTYLTVSNVTETTNASAALYELMASTSTGATLRACSLSVIDSRGNAIPVEDTWTLVAATAEGLQWEPPAYYDFSSASWSNESAMLAYHSSWTLGVPSNQSLTHAGDSMEVSCGPPIGVSQSVRIP